MKAAGLGKESGDGSSSMQNNAFPTGLEKAVKQVLAPLQEHKESFLM